MMRSIVIAAGLMLVATFATAQPAGPPPGGFSGGPGWGGGPPGGPGMGPPGHHMGPPGGHMGPPPPPPSRGAQFRFGLGERRIFIKCAEEDATKVCVDAILPVLDKMLQSR